MKSLPETVPTLRASTACPMCETRYVVDVQPVFKAKRIGTYTIGGSWPKIVATQTWKWTCTSCEATGRASAPPYLPRRPWPTAECGHGVATAHYPSLGGHQNCPGCCPSCHIEKERRERSHDENGVTRT